jgi:hypothetical protein
VELAQFGINLFVVCCLLSVVRCPWRVVTEYGLLISRNDRQIYFYGLHMPIVTSFHETFLNEHVNNYSESCLQKLDDSGKFADFWGISSLSRVSVELSSIESQIST